MYRIHFSGSSPSPANIFCFIIHIKLILSALHEKYHPLQATEKAMGVSARAAVIIDRLNHPESVEMEPFTAGVHLPKPQQETSSAGSQGTLSFLALECLNPCSGDFQSVLYKLCLYLELTILLICLGEL